MRFMVAFFSIFAMVLLSPVLATGTFHVENHRQSGTTCDKTIYYDVEVQTTASSACIRLKKHRISRLFHRPLRFFEPPRSFGIPVRPYVQFPLPLKTEKSKTKLGLGRDRNQAYILIKPEDCQLVAVMMYQKRKPQICLWSKLDSNGIDPVVDRF